ncbi:MAG: GNAT family N-acetyltransferase [Candidatus Eisenbacteria bacterium]|uniref:GNAT family N-acetyltransferase n=1 Tax=Eiseniibacteriota bacterium TaxID=2212470 RepID=A0A948RSH0_UNCEI|nr:GNAT family N-acetyltransferase [Candidatus Eisenbacteria bacterium]MBU1947663.1 GNAT family N-acetyltransferase [Candidatus Eisenbacteria bacterium]MBU2690183.1 GNAT family N-acetyltransferase [Candidatus Eisenbacteria bacterium]
MVVKRWKEAYDAKITTARAAMKYVRPGQRIFIGTGCGEPQSLVRALAAAAGDIPDTEILHTLTLGVAPHTDVEYSDIFRHNAFFVGPNTREAVNEGRADYTPIFLSLLPKLFKSGAVPIDVALIQVTPPDEHGYCSLGVSVDIVKAAAQVADIVVAEVNKQTPRVLGDSFIHVDKIHHFVENDEPLLEIDYSKPSDISLRIGHYIADLIDDGSTIQVGIGEIPNAVLACLENKKDLGVHTEMFSDGILDLFEKGAITNRRKSLHPGKIIASFCMGTKRLYNFIHNNPIIEFHPSDYVNDPFVIAQHDNMVAVNSALEIDLGGQVCADSLGYYFYSGLGGQTDFMRGTARSLRGKPIIAIASTTDDGEHSRIVPHLSEGAGVVTTRGDVHYIVTEYGVAYLHGKTIRERAISLINIAHPKFRDELLAHAKRIKYVYQDQMSLNVAARYPQELEKTKRIGKEEFLFRPIRPTDEKLVRAFFYAASKKTKYFRFHGELQTFRHRDAQTYCNVDYESNYVIAVVRKEEDHEHIIAMGQYEVNPATNMGECAFMVSDEFQGKGIGTLLLKRLIEHAKSKGVAGFVAEVLATNQAMLHVFHKSGYTIHSSIDEGVYHVSFTFHEGLERAERTEIQS